MSSNQTPHKYIPVDEFHKKMRARANRISYAKTSHQEIPKMHSLREKVPEIYDQGELGSCTANAFCAAYRILCPDRTFKPSRLWVYFYERLAEDPSHCVGDLTDSGADVVDGEKYVQVHGVCSETLWPYDITKYNVRPPHNCTAEAVGHKIHSYERIKFADIKHFIASGIPVLIAIEVYESFETSVHGKIPMPGDNDQLLGGHELCLIGYDDTTHTFEVQNSWGHSWGDSGFCHIPYSYISDSNLCQQISVIKL